MAMKTTAMVIALLIGGATAARADTGKHSMKGWELYTWFDLGCSASPQVHSAPNDDSWCAVLVPGTNRVKKPSEIKQTPMKWRDLASALAGLRRGENVAWITTPGTFEPPAAALRSAIDAVAAQRGLTLTDVERR
jgi:hypothetical protein